MTAKAVGSSWAPVERLNLQLSLHNSADASPIATLLTSITPFIALLHLHVASPLPLHAPFAAARHSPNSDLREIRLPRIQQSGVSPPILLFPRSTPTDMTHGTLVPVLALAATSPRLPTGSFGLDLKRGLGSLVSGSDTPSKERRPLDEHFDPFQFLSSDDPSRSCR